MKEVLKCNGCGRVFQVENEILREDIFEGKKQWGYFSKRDGQIHSFLLCEECYDEMISQFKIPVDIRESNEMI